MREREEKKPHVTLKSKLKQWRAPRGHNPLTFGRLQEGNGSQEHNSCTVKYKDISEQFKGARGISAVSGSDNSVPIPWDLSLSNHILLDFKNPQQTITKGKKNPKTCRFKNAFFIQVKGVFFLKPQEVSQFLKDSQHDIKLWGREKGQTAKKPKVTIRLLPQSKNLLFLQGQATFIAERGRYQDLLKRVMFALGFKKQSWFLEFSHREKYYYINIHIYLIYMHIN